MMEQQLEIGRCDIQSAPAGVEGQNNKVRVITRCAYGLRTSKAINVAIYYTLSRLPEPSPTHIFY